MRFERSNWSWVRGKYLMREIDQRSATGGETLLSLSKERGVVPRGELGFDGEGRADSLVGYKRVDAGVLVMNKMQAWNGMFGLSRLSGIVSPEYTTLVPLSTSDPRFLVYLLRSDFYVGEFSWRSRGMGTAFLRLHPENLLDTPFFVPAVEIQRAIADYLDTETARIDALIAKKQRMIELLREQFESRLAAAFDVRGVPTPALSVVVRIAEGQVDPRVEPFASMMLVAPDHVESGTGRLLQATSAAEQGAISGKYLCEAGDVIYSKIRPALRKVCIATERCLTSADMYPMRPSPELVPRFLSYFLLSDRFSSHAVLESERVAMPKINRDAFGRIQIPIPARFEQLRVVDELDAAQSHLERVSDRIRRQSELLREHRQALITAAVTGELEVPGVAA